MNKNNNKKYLVVFGIFQATIPTGFGSLGQVEEEMFHSCLGES